MDSVRCTLLTRDMRKPLPRDTQRKTVRSHGRQVVVQPQYVCDFSYMTAKLSLIPLFIGVYRPLLRRLVRVDEVFLASADYTYRERRELFRATHFLREQRDFDNVEVFRIEVHHLINVLVLHCLAYTTMLAVRIGWRVEKLVTHNRMRINAILGELLNQALRLVEREELSNTHTHEGRLGLVLELRVDFGDDLAHSLQLGEHILLVRAAAAHHALELLKHGAQTFSECAKLGESFLEHAREAQKAQGMTSRRRVEYHHTVFHRLDQLHNLSKAHRLIYTRDRKGEVLHEGRQRTTLLLRLLDHLLHAAGRVDFHSAQVVEPVHFHGLAAELLSKCI